MISRFKGTANVKSLVDAIKANRLVEHNEELAKRLAAEGELIEYLVTDKIIKQGNFDRDLYLILVGEVRIFVNGRFVATRGPREMVGEMALIDATAMRSATVIPWTTVVALKVSEPVFDKLAADYPRMYKPIAYTIADRLRERSKFHRAPNDSPLLFIGSSVEGLNVANHVHLSLMHDKFTTVVWNQEIFGPSKSTLAVLSQQAKESDFAAFIFGPDDKTTSRAKRYAAPRDNVIFEMGLFLNELGRDRTFIVKEQDKDLKIPTDLLGVNPIQYKIHDPKYFGSAIASICTQLRDLINTQGVR